MTSLKPLPRPTLHQQNPILIFPILKRTKNATERNLFHLRFCNSDKFQLFFSRLLHRFFISIFCVSHVFISLALRLEFKIIADFVNEIERRKNHRKVFLVRDKEGKKRMVVISDQLTGC
jgi:hypothetical protein